MQNKFNVCQKCDSPLKIIRTVRLETCRVRTYCCPTCKTIRKSVERYYETPNQENSGTKENDTNSGS